MADVFVSYARSDKALVAPLVAAIEAQGWSVWWDPEITPGQEFDRQITAELKKAAAVLVVWTPNSVESRWVRGEAREGADRGILVPVRFASAELPIDVRALHTTELDNWKENPRCLEAREVISALEALIARQRATQPTTAISSPALSNSGSDRVGICVLPFANMSGDPEQEYFSDGMVEEIVTGLSRIKWLFVISRSSTLIYKGKPVDARTVGRELSVRYMLQGSVRRSGNHVRVTGQLIETETASNVWADRYEGTMDDIFRLQDDMTMSVIGAVEPTLRKAEVQRAQRKRPENLNAYDLFLRALPFAATAMPENADKALKFLLEAIRLEPNYSAVHGFIAWCHEQRYLRGGLHAETRQAALHHAHAAIETGSDDAMALATGGFVVGVLERDYQTAVEAIDRSLALSPSLALAFGFSSIIRVLMGEDSTAIEHARIGIRLSPYDPLIYLPYIGLAYAHFFTGSFAESASAASRASAANPRFSVPCYLRTAALIRVGRLDDAKSTAKVLLELQPGFTISGLKSGNITTAERMDMLVDALRQAGLPE